MPDATVDSTCFRSDERRYNAHRSTSRWWGRGSPASTFSIACARPASRRWRWTRPTMSAAPGTGTDILARAATFRPSTTATLSIRNWRARGQWSEKYATQPEILRYLGFVADRYDLRRDIRFHTRVTEATWDQAAERWLLTTDNGATVSCRYYIMATGCLSAPKPPEIDGVQRLQGRGLFHRPLAASGGQPRRQARRGHRHGIVRDPGDPVDRGAGGRISPSSSARRTLPCPPTMVPRRRTALPCWKATAPVTASRPAGRSPVYRGRNKRPSAGNSAMPSAASASRRRGPTGDLVCILTQLWADQGVDIDGNALRRAAHSRENPRDRQGSRDGGSADPARPSVWGQASLPRYQLLRHLQPSERHAGEPAAGADQVDHGLRHQDRQAQLRRRRHRVRHRLRCHDRRDHGRASDHGPRRKVAVRRLGRRPADLSRAHRGRLSRICS